MEVGKIHCIQISSGSQRGAEAEIQMPLTAAALPRSGTLPGIGISGHGACLWSAIAPPGRVLFVSSRSTESGSGPPSVCCCRFPYISFFCREVLTHQQSGRGGGTDIVEPHVRDKDCWNQRDQRSG